MTTTTRSQKSGMPPGELIHIGAKHAGAVKITVIDYDDNTFYEKTMETVDECFVLRDKPTVTWVNIEGLHRTDIIQKLGECFNFHPLVMEDILNTEQRPKMEDYGSYMYTVLKMLHQDDKQGFVIEQISLILGSNFVISFQEGIEGDVFNIVRERLRTGKGRLRSQGADYLVYSLIDAVVDDYFIVLEDFGEKIEDLEEELIKTPTAGTMQRIHEMKRRMILLRKAVWPLREVINHLGEEESPLVRESTRVYLRDVYDHTIQEIDAIETYREMLSGMTDIYLSSVSNRMNETMKFLTLIGTIFMPLTFIAGVYGMNFEFMPEIKWRFGYYAALILMLGVCVTMLLYFKKKKWL